MFVVVLSIKQLSKYVDLRLIMTFDKCHQNKNKARYSRKNLSLTFCRQDFSDDSGPAGKLASCDAGCDAESCDPSIFFYLFISLNKT